MTARLENRVALVVGAGSSGDGPSIGEASALAYARAGAAVVAVDIDAEAAERTAAMVTGLHGRCLALVADAADSAQLSQAVETAHEHFGRIDILQNNVGVMAFGDPAGLAVEEWDRVTEINGRSQFLACKYVLPYMEAVGQGAIVNISSIAGLRWTGAPYIAYAASKAATIGFTRSLALQYAPRGIRVNCVVPGFVESAMMRGGIRARFGAEAEEAIVAERAARLPMKRMAKTEEIAAACVFLASDEATYITAAVLVVDGGASASCAI